LHVGHIGPRPWPELGGRELHEQFGSGGLILDGKGMR
jgi:hypothetical protein